MNDIFNNPRAFDPFYTDEISICGTRAGRTLRGTFQACVFDQGLDAPIGDESVDSKRRRITVSIQRGDGNWITGAPQIGDIITLEDGAKFAVDSVSATLGDTWEMEARQA